MNQQKTASEKQTATRQLSPCCQERSNQDTGFAACESALFATAILYIEISLSVALIIAPPVKGFAFAPPSLKIYFYTFASPPANRWITTNIFSLRALRVTGCAVNEQHRECFARWSLPRICNKSSRQKESIMIQIINERQFVNAAKRVKKERMLVQNAGFRRYFVTNKQKGTRYEVFFSILNGKKFGACNCPAGYPMDGSRAPMVCKHLYCALSMHIALMETQTSH